MADYKSLDYLQEIKKDNIMSNNDIQNMLQNIAYILADNGYQDARCFLEDIAEAINEKEIDL